MDPPAHLLILDELRMSNIVSTILFSKCSTPTHTEDGIPIRKVYVGNLPPDATRKELFEFFAQFGTIKNCWVKNATAENIKSYAFVTFIEPKDAHKALTASRLECNLRGKFLRILPADSWHQPISDSQGNVITWSRKPISNEPNAGQIQQASTSREGESSEPQYDILDILNHDCITHIMSYLPLHDLVRSEAVSKRWRTTVQDYFMNFRELKTSDWILNSLTTNKLRQILQRMPNLRRLSIDQHGPALNDRTAQAIARFSLQLERLTIEHMTTKFWSPVVSNCKYLKSLTFNNCRFINDQSLIILLNTESSIENLHLNRIHEIQGYFLLHMVPRLQQITLNHCWDIKPNFLIQCIDKLTDLKYLCIDLFYTPTFTLIPHLAKLTKLEELHMSYVYGNPQWLLTQCHYECICDELAESLKCLKELRKFSFVRSKCIHDKVLKQIAETCTKLDTLDITASNTNFSNQLETMAGINAVVAKCTELQHVKISNESRTGDLLRALSKCKTLRTLVARGHPSLGDEPLNVCISRCHMLEVIDVGNCPALTDLTVLNCLKSVEQYPRHLTLHINATNETANAVCNQLPTHPLLTVKLDASMRHQFGPLIDVDSDEHDENNEFDILNTDDEDDEDNEDEYYLSMSTSDDDDGDYDLDYFIDGLIDGDLIDGDLIA